MADTGLHLGLRVPTGLDDPAAGQVVAYKIGKREWRRVRAQARQRIAGLTNRQFHTTAPRLGPLPLRLLGPEVLTTLGDAPQ
ncbi:MAG: DUF885 family protein [Actinomycetes bacterium]